MTVGGPPLGRGRCRVLHVAWSGRIGGIERQLATLARLARAEGRGDHGVLFLDGRGSVGDALVAEGLAQRLLYRRSWAPLGLLQLARALRATRPQVLHLHTHSLVAHLVAAGALPRTPWVYTEHAPRGVRGGSLKFRALYRLLRRRCTRFVALSPSVAAVLRNRRVDPARIVVVPNAVDVAVRTSPRLGSAHTVGTVARLARAKRIDLLLDTVAELRRRGLPCTALIVGDGRGREFLESHARERGIGAHAEFAGERDDVLPLLDRMDAFLVTSPVELFGIAALEAMARGVPVVSMACRGGLRDVASEGGILLPDREPATAADAIAAVLESPAERERLRALGAVVVERSAPGRVLAALEAVYEEVSR